MSIAFSWVQYQTTTTTVDGVTRFPAITTNCPFLHMGTLHFNGAYSAKKVLGLRFQGEGAKNIKIWVDGYNDGSTDYVWADWWYDNGTTLLPYPRVPILGNTTSAENFTFKYTPIPDPTDLTLFNSGCSAWTTMTATAPGSNTLDDAITLDVSGEKYSEVFGFAIKAPTDVPSGYSLPDNTHTFSLRNFRLMCSFDTTDGL